MKDILYLPFGLKQSIDHGKKKCNKNNKFSHVILDQVLVSCVYLIYIGGDVQQRSAVGWWWWSSLSVGPLGSSKQWLVKSVSVFSLPDLDPKAGRVRWHNSADRNPIWNFLYFIISGDLAFLRINRRAVRILFLEWSVRLWSTLFHILILHTVDSYTKLLAKLVATTPNSSFTFLLTQGLNC